MRNSSSLAKSSSSSVTFDDSPTVHTPTRHTVRTAQLSLWTQQEKLTSRQFQLVDTVDRLADLGVKALEKAMGDGAVTRLRAAVDEHLASFNAMAERLYINWLQTAART